jgi:pimeloyl-ACP methyl ester carboxylesterase
VSGAVDDLRAVLAAAGEAPPFVLVGMSLGGTHVRVFTGRHPDDVAGLVFVDAYMPDVDMPSLASLDPRIGADFAAGGQETGALIEATEPLDWSATLAELDGVTVAGRPVEVLNVPLTYRIQHELLTAADQARLIEDWEAWTAALSPGRTRVTIAERSGHIIQADRPDLVIAAIERFVADVRGG